MAGVPLSIIVPYVGVEFDNARASKGSAEMPFKVYLLGQKVAAGSAVEGTAYQVYNEAEVVTLAGKASMLHVMARAFWKNNSVTDVFIVALDDAVGTQATRVLTLTSGPATEAGELDIYVNSTRMAVSVAVGDTITTIGDNLVTKLAEYDYLNWTAANNAGVVTFTNTNDGVAAGDCDMRVADNPGEKVPAGFTASFGAIVAGTVDPDVQTAIDGIGDDWANIIVNPYDDDTNMGVIEDHLDTQAGPMYQRDGLCYQSKRDTVSNLNTFASGSGRNSPYMALCDAGSRQTSSYELSAAVAGQVAASVQDDPAIPLHRLSVKGFRSNAISAQRTLLENNSLAKNGCMSMIDGGNGPQTFGTVTMYLTNSADAADTSYRQQNTIFNLMRLRYRFVNGVLSRFPRAKMMDSAERLNPGQSVITPDIGKGYALDWFQENEADGQVQGFEEFKEQVVCRIASPGRMEWILPPSLVDQFIVGSGVLQFG